MYGVRPAALEPTITSLVSVSVLVVNKTVRISNNCVLDHLLKELNWKSAELDYSHIEVVLHIIIQQKYNYIN